MAWERGLGATRRPQTSSARQRTAASEPWSRAQRRHAPSAVDPKFDSCAAPAGNQTRAARAGQDDDRHRQHMTRDETAKPSRVMVLSMSIIASRVFCGWSRACPRFARRSQIWGVLRSPRVGVRARQRGSLAAVRSERNRSEELVKRLTRRYSAKPGGPFQAFGWLVSLRR